MESMSYPGFGMYSNNNYLPDIGQFSNNAVISQPRCRAQTGNQGVQFTFAVPTQANSYTFTLAQTNQPRGIYSNPINHQGVAPGVGTSWQHAVPVQMPWSEVGMSSQMNLSGISAFSATPTFSAPAFSIYNSIPSCSSTPKRPKRHSSVDIENEAPTSKCRITAEKMAAKMEGLSLDCSGVSTSSPNNICRRRKRFQSEPLPDLDFTDMVSSGTTCTTMSEGWKRFHEIENRLNTESDEEELPAEEDGVKVHISKNIAKDILNSTPLIPQQILNDLNKPCMEIVLWKSPGGFDRDNIKVTSSSSTTSSEQQSIDSIVQSIGINSNASKDMEEDTLENYEDVMDL